MGPGWYQRSPKSISQRCAFLLRTLELVTLTALPAPTASRLCSLISCSIVFLQMALGFQDPRVRVEITNGIKWVEEAAEGTYDAIIVDSSDPVGPAEVLFQKVRAVHRLWMKIYPELWCA